MTKLLSIIIYNTIGDKMKVKVFDESHEKDLETEINNFIENEKVDIVDIKFSVSACMYGEEQIYCFSSMLIYR